MRRSLVLLSLVALFSACNSDSTAPAESVAGTYTLRTVGGAPLPYVAQQAGTFKYEITDDAFTLTDAGTWTEIGHDRTTSNGVVTTTPHTDAGTYARNGAGITLVSPNVGALLGTVGGGTLTINESNVALVYMR